MFFSFAPKLALLNCLSGNLAIVADFPAWIGGLDAHLVVDDSDTALCEFIKNGKGLEFTSHLSDGCYVNGEWKKKALLVQERDYALLIDNHMVLCTFTKKPKEWAASRNRDTWRIVNRKSDVLSGPASLDMIVKAAPLVLKSSSDAILNHAASTSGFYLKGLADTLGFEISSDENTHLDEEKPARPVLRSTAEPSKLTQPASAALQQPSGNLETGEFTCPVCWLRFDRGDVMHIAAHASLKGDPVLGEDALTRFSATRFNDAGQALDAMGIPVTDTACPHCRRKLPPGFLNLPQHIISIVGAPSSGKSYFLSVLTKVLQTSLFKHYSVAFYDGDPAENIALTQMKNKLFSASSPAEAKLAKTLLEGDMYLEVPRMGRKVRMPKPFVFNLSHQARPESAVSTVFYDNAGEHFEPTANSVESPGAQHVASASGIIFLFDPTYNMEFRKRLADHPDPQIKDQRFDQQDTILAEMNSRMKNLMALDFREKAATPLALVVGKCDVWQGILDNCEFMNPVRPEGLDLGIVQANSDLVREMLLTIVPGVVANAEAVSHHVMYFPVSAFGCSPEFVGNDDRGRPIFSPDPTKISPVLVDVPMLWLLSRIEPDLVPSQGVNGNS